MTAKAACLSAGSIQDSGTPSSAALPTSSPSAALSGSASVEEAQRNLQAADKAAQRKRLELHEQQQGADRVR